jgi:hypothetical protein
VDCGTDHNALSVGVVWSWLGLGYLDAQTIETHDAGCVLSLVGQFASCHLPSWNRDSRVPAALLLFGRYYLLIRIR